MENERERGIKDFEEQIKTLSEEKQKAMYWIINNIEIVEKLTKGEKMSEMEVKKYIQMAKEKDDYLFWALVVYKQSKDNFETEKQQEKEFILDKSRLVC